MEAALKSTMRTALKRRKLHTVAIAVAALALPASATATVDYTDKPGYVASSAHSCNNDHGAFTYYSDGSGRTTIAPAAKSGGSNGEPGIGDTTGPAQKAFAENCKSE
jgi:hypothetical protein